MPDKTPIVIPDDILAKYEGQEGQSEAFDAALQKAMSVPASSVPPPGSEGETGKRGPARKKTEG